MAPFRWRISLANTHSRARHLNIFMFYGFLHTPKQNKKNPSNSSRRMCVTLHAHTVLYNLPLMGGSHGEFRARTPNEMIQKIEPPESNSSSSSSRKKQIYISDRHTGVRYGHMFVHKLDGWWVVTVGYDTVTCVDMLCKNVRNGKIAISDCAVAANDSSCR